MNPLIDQSKINFYSRYEIYTKEIWRMIYYLRCVNSAYCTPMSMKSGLIMINFVLQRWFLSSASPLRIVTFHPDWRAHLSGSPRGGRSPGHPSGWPADTSPPDSCRRSVLQAEDTRPRVGGGRRR